jgi:hypothetical protein
LLLLPAAFFGPGLIGFDPFSLRGMELPLAVGGALLGCVGVLALWRPVIGVPAAVGAFSAWLVFTMRVGLNGTPFGFLGLTEDHARLTALATRYSASAWPSDGIVAGVPTEYPPLFPWVVGRVSALTGVPAWRLLPKAEIVLISAAVLVAFLLWNRLIHAAPVALALAVAGFTIFYQPAKAYEVFCMAVTVAWVLLTVTRSPQGRLHWAASGVIGGFLLLTYQGYFMYSAAGIVALVVLTWRTEPDQRAYAWYLVKCLVSAAVVASPFLLTFGIQKITGGSQYVADLFQTPAITGDLTPFFSFTVIGVLQLAGLIGMVWRRKVSWWASPLLMLTLGTYVYRGVYALVYVFSLHTGMLHHADVMTDYLFAMAGVLTVCEVGVEAIARFELKPPRGVGTAVMVAVVVWTGSVVWAAWMPFDGSAPVVNAASAFAEPAPNGHRAHSIKSLNPTWLPVNPIRRFVEARLGKGVQPHTLAYDERLFAFLPWKGYNTVDGTASMSTIRWNDRYHALVKLAEVADPQAFAQASAKTRFGRIDVFVLHKQAAGWVWSPWHMGAPVVFQPYQFDPSVFDVNDSLPGHTVVAVRRS